RRQHAVAGRRGPAALYVAEDGHPSLEPGPALDLGGEQLPDAAEPDVPELVERRLLRHLALLARRIGELVALRHDDDREVLAATVPLLDLGAGLFDRQRMLGDQDHVGAAGDA